MSGKTKKVNVDLDTIRETSIVWTLTDGNPSQYHFPDGAINGWLFSISDDNIYVKQIYYRAGTPNSTGNYMYTRTRYNDGWSRWFKFAGELLP